MDGRNGKRLGRRPIEETDARKVKTVRDLYAKGLSVRRIAQDVGLALVTVTRLVAHTRANRGSQ